MEIDFEWDEKKNEINQKKHGVSFEEAKSCFEDEHARVFFDVEHSKDEDRGGDDLIVNRIISARKATKKEFQYYWNARKGDEP